MSSFDRRLGGFMVSALVSGSSGPWSVPGEGHCVVFLGKHFILKVPLSAQVHTWVPANLMLRVTLRWTSITFKGGSRDTPTRVMLQRAGWLKVGFYLKAVFPSPGLMRISRSRFKQSRNCLFISRIYGLRSFVNFLVIFGSIWEEIVFLNGLVKFREIRNGENLMWFEN